MGYKDILHTKSIHIKEEEPIIIQQIMNISNIVKSRDVDHSYVVHGYELLVSPTRYIEPGIFARLRINVNTEECKLYLHTPSVEDLAEFNTEFLFTKDNYFRTPPELVYLHASLNILENAIKRNLKYILLTHTLST